MDEERRSGGVGSGGGGEGGDRGRLEAGAGLEQSRKNEEFIAWLGVWGPRILYVVAAVVLVYAGLQWWGRYQEGLTDDAFADLAAAIESGDPVVLSSVAEEHGDRAAVAELARLELGRMYRLAGVTRRPIEAGDAGEGGLGMLREEQAEARLREAAVQFERVLERTAGVKPLLAQQARWELATVFMSLGETERAEEVLNAYMERAEALGLAEAQRSMGRARLAMLDGGLGGGGLPSRGSLPASALPPEDAEGNGADGGDASAALEELFRNMEDQSGGNGEAVDVRDPFAGSGLEVENEGESGDEIREVEAGGGEEGDREDG